MPHEEVLTLGNLYNMEIGFIYKINQHTTDLIRNHLDNLDVLWEYTMKVLDPNDYPLSGEDLIGVLLIYEDREYYMYNILSNDEIFNKYKTNATYFQVACGIYGALCTILLDNLEQNIYYVDELLLNTNSKYGEYLSYYMQNFVVGVNSSSDGLLLE